MSGVITLQDRTPEIVQNFMQNYLESQRARDQREYQNKSLAQNAQQHQDSLGYNNRLEDDRVTSERAKMWLETVAKPLANDPARLSQEISKVKQVDPSLFEHLHSLSVNDQATPGQMAEQNADQYKLGQTQKTLAGSPDVQATDVTRQIGGVPMQKFAFEDQTQRQGGGQAYQDFTARQGGAKTTASEDQTNKTKRDLGFTAINSEAPVRAAQAGLYTAEANKANAQTAELTRPRDMSSAVDAIASRQASLDDYAKKGSKDRGQLIDAVRKQGILAPSNEKERDNLVSANNTASLLTDRMRKLRELAPVLDNPSNRVAIAGLMNSSDGAFANIIKGEIRNRVDPKVIEYVQEARNFKEDMMSLRKYLGNTPMRSDKQMAIMIGQGVTTEAGSSKDLNRMLDAFEPAVNKLMVGNQAPTRPQMPGQAAPSAQPSADALALIKKYSGQ